MKNKPFSLLIKPASADCNLRCDYCFYIDKLNLYPDEKIHRMTNEVLEKLISSYMATDQPMYVFGWQGGEPTLMGVDFFRKVVELQQTYGKPGDTISNGLQTNGILIDDEFAQFLAEYNFLVGISLDGPEEIHDRYRRDIGKVGTHSRVVDTIRCLERNKVEYNILTLVNSANVDRGGEVYRYLCDMGIRFHQYIPCVEFDNNNNKMPFAITGEEWGKFLCDVFDEWVKAHIYNVSIRFFDSILNLMLHGSYTSCHMAGNCCQYFVVEYNGDIYPCDFFVEPSLKLGNIHSTTWETAIASELYQNFGAEKNKWNSVCTSCEYLIYCSGDCLKHRIYGENPSQTLSWLCDGYKKFFEHSIPVFKEIASDFQAKQNIKDGLFCDRKFGRNDTCFCGSGNKYKKCHGIH